MTFATKQFTPDQLDEEEEEDAHMWASEMKAKGEETETDNV